MQPNRTLERLRGGEPALGAWISTMSPRSIEVLATTDLDWVVLDMEHTPLAEADVEALLRAVDTATLTPLVRIPAMDHGLRGICKRVLDSGAQGIVVPRVESKADAEAIVEAAYFPPIGERGVGGRIRANRHGADFDPYVEHAAEETFVVAQLETVTAARHAEEILAVDGIDAAFVGENDLSATHGVPGRKDEPGVQEDVERILAAAERADAFAGLVAPSVERIERRLEEGFDFVSIGSDLSLIDRAATNVLEAVR